MLAGRKSQKLEARRAETLFDIRREQRLFEVMVQRAQLAGELPDATVLATVRARLTEIEEKAGSEINENEFYYLLGAAEQQSQLRAYICPFTEILNEGNMYIDRIEEWNVPRLVITKLRNTLGKNLAGAEPHAARSALRAIFEEYDSWYSYTDDYDDKMKTYTQWLFGITVVLLISIVISIEFIPIIIIDLLLAGAVGSCVSIMTKMPMLDVSFSGDLQSYRRRVLSRVGVGVVASLVGCAFLGWGLLPIAIQNETFADIVNACTATPLTSCTGRKALILLGVPMLFGFSERALTSLTERLEAQLRR